MLGLAFIDQTTSIKLAQKAWGLWARLGVAILALTTELLSPLLHKQDVFKSLASDTYIILGEAKIEYLSAQAKDAAAEQFKRPKNISSVRAPA